MSRAGQYIVVILSFLLPATMAAAPKASPPKGSQARNQRAQTLKPAAGLPEKTANNFPADDPPWFGTGDMATPRTFFTATLLQNGKILAAGGWDGNLAHSALATCEIYDPSTGNWSGTGSLNKGREFATATLLKNGKVLIVGGDDGGVTPNPTTVLGSAEIYDPAAGTWTTTVSMTVAREQHTATLLHDGTVLVVGGYGDAGSLNSVALFDPGSGDPDSGIWSTKAPMNLSGGRGLHSATLLTSGDVLIAGGSQAAVNALASVEVYNPSLDSWTTLGDLQAARASHSATLLADGTGTVLFAGGWGCPDASDCTTYEVLPDAELYDPLGGGSSAGTGSLTAARLCHTANLLPSGTVLVVGGTSDNLDLVDSAEIYDPTLKTWSSDGSSSSWRNFHTAVMLPSGHVLIAGGFGTDGATVLDSSSLYSPAAGIVNAAQPVWDAVHPILPTTICLGADYLVANGSNFGGISECSGGNGSQNSSTNYPLLEITDSASNVTYLPVDPAVGWTSTSFQSVVVNGIAAGTAHVRIIANGVPSDPVLSSSPTITINAPPSVSPGSPSDPAAICSGATTTLTVAATGTGLSYQWYQGTAPSTANPVGTNSNSFTTPALSSTTSYWVRVTGTCGAVDSRTATVTVNALPTASSVMGGGSYCSGGAGVAVGLSGSQSGVNYQLYNGASLVGSPVAGTGSAISFGNQTAAGTYTVVATNATTGCTANMTGSATVTINVCTTYRVPFNTTPTKVSTGNHGTDVTVTWDASHCASTNYHIIYGKGENLSAWTIGGGKCAIGTGGTYGWTGVPDPSSYTKRFLWILVVGDNGIGTEGSWGLTSAGTEEGGSNASNVCSMMTKDLSGTCP